MTNVEMTRSIASPSQRFVRHKVYRVSDDTAADWIGRGLAKPTERHPDGVDALLRRLEIGAGNPCLFLPFLGEFGHLIMSHIRLVHFHQASEKVVCCRPGEEVLFPSATAFVTDWTDPIADKNRYGTLDSRVSMWPEIVAAYPNHVPLTAGGLTREQEIYQIFPGQRIPFTPKKRGHRADIVLGVRQREASPEKNWQHWKEVAKAISAAGNSFAVIGGAATSIDLPGQVMRTKGDTDAAIELLQTCKLFVGTDTGASHLAASVGAPMLVFREWVSGQRDMTGRMREANEQFLFLPNAWDRPKLVIEATLALAKDPPKAIGAAHFRAQQGEDRWLSDNWEAIGLPDRGIFVEVGAADGETFSNTYWLARAKGWTGLLIEPDPRQIDRLQRARPESQIATVACAAAKGTAQFGLEREPTHSGLLRTCDNTLSVQTDTLTNLLTTHRMKRKRIDLLSIDTEGTELDVWAGLDLKRWRPRVVIIEVETVGLPSNKAAVIERLTADGYQVAAELGGNLIFTDSTVVTSAAA